MAAQRCGKQHGDAPRCSCFAHLRVQGHVHAFDTEARRKHRGGRAVGSSTGENHGKGQAREIHVCLPVSAAALGHLHIGGERARRLSWALD